MDNIAVFTNLTEGEKARLTRLSKGLRQIDLASLARVNMCDVTAIEKDRYLQKTRKDRILAVLGLLDGEGASDDHSRKQTEKESEKQAD
jgi:transcriptional regulator with XRE-family HTH domain